jgi:2-oxo-3-hexenedioate decarboxylase/2-keto-4-pentenoate hydratase
MMADVGTGLVSSRFDQAAAWLCGVRQRRAQLDRLPPDLVPRDEAEAYAVQDVLHGCLAGAGWGEVTGYKVGCTTPVMQAYLRISNPCAGAVFASTVQHQHGRFQHAQFVRVGVECEVAVVLAHDLKSAAPLDRATAARAVEACMAAIEVVDDRYVDYHTLDTPTLIADDFFGAGCVLGPPLPGFDPLLLSGVRATMSIDDREVGSGVGTDILGHPLDALVWLANTMAERGVGLRRGDFVLLGSLVQTHWVAPGQSVVIRNDALGEVRAQFL